jgi:predicted nucleotidyltransferase
MDVFAVAEALINHIKSRCPNDIAIAAYYGSYAQGTATKRSDLDFFFIPATPEGFRVSLQFVVGDISFDFWPISWERAQRMASFDEPTTTIIADCKLLYVRSEEDRDRFMKLRETIVAT